MFRFLCPFLLISATSLGADLILQPDGLSVGDRYRLFLTTSESRDATSTDIEDYHEFVQSVADPWVLCFGVVDHDDDRLRPSIASQAFRPPFAGHDAI